MIELGGLRADAVEMGLISLLFAEERHVGGCWRSSVVSWPSPAALRTIRIPKGGGSNPDHCDPCECSGFGSGINQHVGINADALLPAAPRWDEDQQCWRFSTG
jgi:hypothetical protein